MMKSLRGRVIDVVILVMLAGSLLLLFDLLIYSNVQLIPTPAGIKEESHFTQPDMPEEGMFIRTIKYRDKHKHSWESKIKHRKLLPSYTSDNKNIDINIRQLKDSSFTTDPSPLLQHDNSLEKSNTNQLQTVYTAINSPIHSSSDKGQVPKISETQHNNKPSFFFGATSLLPDKTLNFTATATNSASGGFAQTVRTNISQRALVIKRTRPARLMTYTGSSNNSSDFNYNDGLSFSHVTNRVIAWDRILSMPSEGFHSFNTTASDIMGNQRPYPELRLPGCIGREYVFEKQPKMSVIVVFHNEARSPLLRCIHSILDRTPADLLLELILVDDWSTLSWLLQPLSDYVSAISDKVKLLRFKRREGLIRARLLGAEEAKGEIIVFFDSHIEVSAEWAEPLVQAIAADPTLVAVPVVDIINWQTFRFFRAVDNSQGSFLWNLDFKYKLLTSETVARRRDETALYPSYVMVGCAHALRRDFFFRLGAYDPGMDIWGGENLEHSFRTWMCGGKVMIVPCSRVAHVFKPRLPYSFQNNAVQVIQRNLMRVVEVWMDDYKQYFYALQSSLPPLDLRTVSERKQLREKLGCKSFDWFLNNIANDIVIPPLAATYFGQLRSFQFDLKCVELDEYDEVLNLVSCERQDVSKHYFYLDRQGRFLYQDFCLALQDGTLAFSEICPDDGTVSEQYRWEYVDRHLRHLGSNSCLTVAQWNAVVVTPCAPYNASETHYEQVWEFTYHFNFTASWDLNKVLNDSLKRPNNAMHFGALENPATKKCIRIFDGAMYEVTGCDQLAVYERVIYVDNENYLRYKSLVIGIDNSTLSLNILPHQRLKLIEDHTSFSWHVDKKYNWLIIQQTMLCLTLEEGSVGTSLGFQVCHLDNESQKWIFRPPT